MVESFFHAETGDMVVRADDYCALQAKYAALIKAAKGAAKIDPILVSDANARDRLRSAIAAIEDN